MCMEALFTMSHRDRNGASDTTLQPMVSLRRRLTLTQTRTQTYVQRVKFVSSHIPLISIEPTSSSSFATMAFSSTGGGDGLALGWAREGGALPGGAPGGGRRLPGSPGGKAFALSVLTVESWSARTRNACIFMTGHAQKGRRHEHDRSLSPSVSSYARHHFGA